MGGAHLETIASRMTGAFSRATVSRRNGAVAADSEGAFRDAIACAVGLLARREYGRAELQSKLIGRGVDPGVAADALEKLSDDGLQSEERFAAALVRRRVSRGYGPVYIRGELCQRRVNDSVADAELKRTDEFWLQAAVEALAGKFPAGNGRETPYSTRARFLARRGFSADTVYRALRSGLEFA